MHSRASAGFIDLRAAAAQIKRGSRSDVRNSQAAAPTAGAPAQPQPNEWAQTHASGGSSMHRPQAQRPTASSGKSAVSSPQRWQEGLVLVLLGLFAGQIVVDVVVHMPTRLTHGIKSRIRGHDRIQDGAHLAHRNVR